MNARGRLAMVMGAALLLASAGTYLLVSGLGIPTGAGMGHKRFGRADGLPQGLIAGSSLTCDGVNWSEVASLLGIAIESWAVPGSSPAEWEQLQRRSPQGRTTFVGVSLYDLNEVWLGDSRAEIVPLGQTLTDLRQSGADLAFAKRLASSYPRAFVRTIFPTAGRSDHVIFGLCDKAGTLLSAEGKAPDGSAKLRLAADYTSEDRISDWPKDRLLRRLTSMRTLQGKPWFFGPKILALRRLLQRAYYQGAVVAIVLAVSPPCISGLLSQPDIQLFEASLVSCL
jgi:hypothetical protein